jgi:hypothetical protein
MHNVELLIAHKLSLWSCMMVTTVLRVRVRVHKCRIAALSTSTRSEHDAVLAGHDYWERQLRDLHGHHRR